MPDIDVFLLGGFQFLYNNAPVKQLQTPLFTRLIAYLVLHANVPQSRQRIAFLFWPDATEEKAKRNLRQLLYRLFNVLPEAKSFIDVRRKTLQWQPRSSYTLDVAAFMAAHEEAGSADEWRRVVELYAGDLLPGFYDDWVLDQRRRLHRQYLDALRQLIESLEKQGALRAAITYAERLVKNNPLHEENYALLMRLHIENEERSAALDIYHAYDDHPDTVKPGERLDALKDQAVQQTQTSVSTLPPSATPLIGRHEELQAVVEQLEEPSRRLLTIVGAGGIGKSHLALAVAHRYKDSTAFVDLTSASSTEDMISLLVRTLDVESDQADGQGFRQRLLDYLQNKRLLLILDNFEHLLESTSFLTEVLRTAPEIRSLVTSRERLKLRDEHVFRLSGLSFSEWATVAEAQENAVVKLFLHHAKRARPSFTLQSEHLAPMYEIARLTNGLPLAIILAASWVQILDPPEIASEMREGLNLLAAAYRDLPPRQQSMRAIFETTWKRLAGPEQRLLAALSVFRSGFTLEAARAVADARPHDLLPLAERALIARHPNGRFGMHALLRQFAAEKLEKEGDPEAVRAAHSDHYLTFLIGQLPDLKGRDQPGALDAIEADFDNVNAAWDWACVHEQWQRLEQVSPVLVIFTITRSRYLDGMALFETAYRAVSSSKREVAVHGYLLASRAGVLAYAGACEHALAAAEELEQMDTAGAHPAAVMYLHSALGIIYVNCDHRSESIELLENVFAFYEKVNEPYFAAVLAIWLARGLGRQGKPAEALLVNRKGLAFVQRGETSNLTSELLYEIGATIWLLEGPTDECERCLWEAVAIRRELGERGRYAAILAQAANLPLWRSGDVKSPRSALEEALRIAEVQVLPGTRATVLSEIATHRLVEGAYQDALALSSEVLSLVNDHPTPRTKASMQHGIAFLGLGNLDEGLRFMKYALQRMVALHWPALIRSYLPFFGVAYFRRGDYDRAIELLALGYAQPYTGRLDIDLQINWLQSELRAEMSEDHFATVWTHGRDLDVLSAAASAFEEL